MSRMDGFALYTSVLELDPESIYLKLIFFKKLIFKWIHFHSVIFVFWKLFLN